MDVRRDFLAGAKRISPILLGVAPFGLVSGVAAVNVGLSPIEAIGMSIFIYAGASQLAAIDLLGQDAALGVIVLTIFVVNVRIVMYSASIAPHLQDLSKGWRSFVAYFLTDHVYALAITTADDEDVSIKWYMLGLGVTMWLVWQLCTLLGIVLGTTVPDGWGLDFVIPLTFLAILVPELKSRIKIGTAALAGGVAVVGAGLPMNLGLVIGTVFGVLFGSAISGVNEA